MTSPISRAPRRTPYCTLVYADTGSYQETARRLGIDRRTVKAKVDVAQIPAMKA